MVTSRMWAGSGTEPNAEKCPPPRRGSGGELGGCTGGGQGSDIGRKTASRTVRKAKSERRRRGVQVAGGRRGERRMHEARREAGRREDRRRARCSKETRTPRERGVRQGAPTGGSSEGAWREDSSASGGTQEEVRGGRGTGQRSHTAAGRWDEGNGWAWGTPLRSPDTTACVPVQGQRGPAGSGATTAAPRPRPGRPALADGGRPQGGGLS